MGKAAAAIAVVAGCLLACGCGPNLEPLACALGATGPDCARPTCQSHSWIVTSSHCSGACSGIVDLVPAPGVSPPTAQMKVGEVSYLSLVPVNLVPAGCPISAQSDGPYVSSDPSVAAVERAGPNAPTVLRAAAPGDTHVYADVPTAAGPARAELGYCQAGGAYQNCEQVNLVLRVVP